jgi:hypothetical protein
MTWCKASPPAVANGDAAEFIVAYTEKRDPYKVIVKAAFYLNKHPLSNESYCAAGLDDDECQNQHDDGCPVTGWYLTEPWEGYPDGAYKLLVKDGDTFKGWQPLPQFSPERNSSNG